MLAVLNTVVLSLMDAHHISNVARQIRRFGSHPDEALDWVLWSVPDFWEALFAFLLAYDKKRLFLATCSCISSQTGSSSNNGMVISTNFRRKQSIFHMWWYFNIHQIENNKYSNSCLCKNSTYWHLVDTTISTYLYFRVDLNIRVVRQLFVAKKRD